MARKSSSSHPPTKVTLALLLQHHSDVLSYKQEKKQAKKSIQKHPKVFIKVMVTIAKAQKISAEAPSCYPTPGGEAPRASADAAFFPTEKITHREKKRGLTGGKWLESKKVGWIL